MRESVFCRYLQLSVKILWQPACGSAVINKLKGSCDLPQTSTAMFSDGFKPRRVASVNNEDMPTVILALFFHYESAAAGGFN